MSIIALSETRVYSLGCLTGIRALFIMKAIPALKHRLSRSLEGRSMRYFLKQLLIHSIKSLSRWVSCRASIAILFFLSV